MKAYRIKIYDGGSYMCLYYGDSIDIHYCRIESPRQTRECIQETTIMSKEDADIIAGYVSMAKFSRNYDCVNIEECETAGKEFVCKGCKNIVVLMDTGRFVGKNGEFVSSVEEAHIFSDFRSAIFTARTLWELGNQDARYDEVCNVNASLKSWTPIKKALEER